MTITAEEIAKTAALARLQIDDTETAEVTERINGILDLVDQMQAIDTSSIKPMANPLDATQVLRPDFIAEAEDKVDSRDRFQAIAPNAEEGLYLVPKVIE